MPEAEQALPPGVGHNLPPQFTPPDPDEVERMLAELYADTLTIADKLIASIDRLPAEIETDALEAKFTDFVTKQVAPIIADIGALHAKEKKAFLDCGRKVDRMFKDRQAELERLKARVSSICTRYKLKKEDAARKVAAEEAARAAKLAEETQSEAAQQYAEQTQRAVETAPKEATKATGLHGGTSGLKRVWKYRITDLDKLPREFLMPNEAAIKAKMKALGSDGLQTAKIEGLEFFVEASTSFRG